MKDVYNPRLLAIERALEGLRLSMQENQERRQQQRANCEERIQGVYHDEQLQDYDNEDVRQGFNLEMVPQNLELTRRVQPRMREDFHSDSEEENTEDYDKRHGKSSEYKINIDIVDFYGGMHVKEFLDWILDVENFFQYMRIPHGKKVKFVAFKLKGAASAWWQNVQNQRRVAGKPLIKSWSRMQRMMKEYFTTGGLPTVVVHEISELQARKSQC